jgi:hypothetical protein
MYTLKANEKRTATTSTGATVSMEYVSGGSFVQVQVHRADGTRAYTRNFQYEWTARQHFDKFAAE